MVPFDLACRRLGSGGQAIADGGVNMKTISIISPCLNEADNVRACRSAVQALFAKGGPLAHYRCEHIFADNASTDGTAEILREIAAEDPSVKVILNARNFGPFRSNFN